MGYESRFEPREFDQFIETSRTLGLNPFNYDIDAPLRLDTVAKLGFPDETMTVKGLRKERDRGRLTTEIIANKEYTTLAAIERMRELCRVQAKEPALSGGTKAGRPTGRSGARPDGSSKKTESEQQLALSRMIASRLKNSLPTTSRKR
ncbi:excisionase [Mesorhizobium sp. AR10]|uniref:excisionase n=1 Tax=Mesorhizobium sp. AR10 TaxID=2865839 RepID=UPI00215E4DAD|nr:excisionase [Mesorhizobium sp. AR10]UVK38227.1 excisionase [Mesorhizobium sp. AR10]